MNKNAVVVLTRGYNDIDKYGELINRNNYIGDNAKKKDFDFVIFHEGNITPDHQTHIQSKSNLPIKFVCISEHAFLPEKADIPFTADKFFFERTNIHFPLSYRHMCTFWFVDFWHYVKDYDKILRIDEDCFIGFSIDYMFESLDNKVAFFGRWDEEPPFAVLGLHNFTCQFLQNNNLTVELENMKHLKYDNKIGINEHTEVENLPRVLGGPYTNVISLNLGLIRQNQLVMQYISEIDKSQNIYSQRWGDLVLWGEVLKIFYNENDYSTSKLIQYYHGSHFSQVN